MIEFDDDDEGEAPGFELEIEPADARDEQRERSNAPAPPPQAPGPSLGPAATPVQRSYVPPSTPPSPATMDKKTIIIGASLVLVSALVVYFFYWDDWFPPDPQDTVAQLAEAAPESPVTFDGELFPSKWTPEQEVAGTVHQVERGYFSNMPFMTHDVLLVTGDYADPSKVQISDIEDHRVHTTAASTPKGTIALVYVIPADAAALAQLEAIQKGQWVTLKGEALVGTISTPDGARNVSTRGVSQIFRLRSVSNDKPAEPAEP